MNINSEKSILKERIKKLESELELYKKKNENSRLNEESIENKEIFRLLFEKSNDPILLIDDYYFIECNDAAVKILGFKTKEEIYKTHPSKLSPEFQPDGKKSFEKAQEMMDIAYKKGYNRFEWVHLNNKGEEMIMDVALTKIPYKGKEMIFTVWRDYTQQKISEKKKLESEQKYISLFEQSADGILVGIEGGEIINANESICNLSGYTKEELIGNNIKILFNPDELTDKPLRYDLVRQGQTVIRERELITKSGKKLFVEMNTKILSDGRMQALFRDITNRKITENELIRSKELLQKAERIAGLGSYFYDIKTNHWESSTVLNEIFGIDNNYKKDFKNWLDIIHKDCKDMMLEYFSYNILQNHEIFDKEYKIQTISTNEIKWVHGFGKLEFDKEGNPINLIGTIQDITKRKITEIALTENEEKYRLLFENANDAIFLMNNDIFIDCNQKTLEMFGCSKEDIIGKPPYMFSPNFQPDGKKSKEKALKKIEDALKGKSKTFEWVHKKLDNTEFYAEVNLNVFTFKGERRILAIVRDITERKKAEIILKENEEKLSNIYHNSSDIIMILNEKGKIININKPVEKLLAYTINELIGKSPEIIIKKEDWIFIEKRINKMFIGENVPPQEFTMITKNGIEIPFEGNSKLINYEGKKAIISIIRNIEERKELEHRIFEVMIETEEKERQRLASDIHDEVGPLLSSLKMYIEMLNQNTGNQEHIKTKLSELIKEIIVNVREVSNALSSNVLLQYGLQSAIKSFVNTQKEIIKINLNSDLEEARFSVKIETVYYRIVKELINNTIKHARADIIEIELKYRSNKLILNYRDNGIGINRDILNDFKLRGLGLYNIENRIKTINGNYTINTELKKGFELKLETKVKK